MVKRTFLHLILYLSGYITASFQDREEKKSIFQLNFVLPLTTNGFYASQYSNKVSLNL